jgi:hypothetical protein
MYGFHPSTVHESALAHTEELRRAAGRRRLPRPWPRRARHRVSPPPGR